jgi:hypothetical protein
VAAGTCPRIGGVHAATRSTPATFAVTIVMCADATSGYRPPGMYAPAADTGMLRWPSSTPGAVSTSKSCSDARWCRANARTLPCTVRMSSRTWSGTVRTIASICSVSSRNRSGSQPSKRREYSRTASSPRARTSAMTAATVAPTSESTVLVGGFTALLR